MSKTLTPETDALRADDNGDTFPILESHARLERERDEARAALAEVERENDQLLASNKTYERDWPILVHERDEARAALAAYAREQSSELSKALT